MALNPARARAHIPPVRGGKLRSTRSCDARGVGDSRSRQL